MSQWVQYRDDFYQEAIASGLVHVKQLRQLYPLGTSVPENRLRIWLERLRKPLPVEPWSQPYRTVNHFKIGADPEFVFVQQMSPKQAYDKGIIDHLEQRIPQEYLLHRVDASGLSLHQGPAFGCDNNGRLVEVRPYPHRSSLEVVASLAATLRWMAEIIPKTRAYEWWSGAYILQDGIGGHVHFGRKRLAWPQRGLTPEIQALDVLLDLLCNLRMFPEDEVVRRQEGDARGQRYGRPGDFRRQNHGYEYRSLPSWLDSPEMAFMVLTLAKLAVHEPKLLLSGRKLSDKGMSLGVIENLLGFYKGRDDDARLAYWMLKTRGLPVTHVVRDFRERWGINKNAFKANSDRVDILPLAIKPTREDVLAMHEHLTTGKPYVAHMGIPTWSAYKLSSDRFYALLPHFQTVGVKGLGELVHDFVGDSKLGINLRIENGDGNGPFLVKKHRLPCIRVSSDLMKKFPANWKSVIQKEFSAFRVNTIGEVSNVVYLPSHLICEFPKQVRRFLTMGWLPLWLARDVKADSPAKYAALKEIVQVKKFPKKRKVIWEYPERKQI